MKQVAQNYRSGELALLEVPTPVCRPAGAVVRTSYSLISAGTEMMKVRESKLSLAGKAKARPDQVKKVLETASQQGIAATYRKMMNRLDSMTPLGYSLAGTIVDVAGDLEDLQAGQRVACGGDQFALHAEYNWVPKNLCIPIPDAVSDEHAAFTTVGAIALQGFRQSDARLGETACVIGLGLVGQLLVQILAAAGVQTVGVDPVADRCKLAEAGGAKLACGSEGDDRQTLLDGISRLTRGHGVDHVLLAASTDSNRPVELAAEISRDRARIVDIGKSKLDLPWNAYYEKELDVRFSRSYGPGRYDPSYEEQGIDYPIGYVRWTEGRNMRAFLDLAAGGKVRLDLLVSSIEPFEDAVSVYERLHEGTLRGIGILFAYPDREEARLVAPQPRPAATSVPARSGVVRIGAIGLGNYATTMLYPHLVDRSDVALATVATATSLSGVNAQKRFGFATASTSYRDVLDDDSIDAVIIATRHASHASLVCESLRAGKAVFVEKPLALDVAQLSEILGIVEETDNDRLMVGFNRRFAPLLNQLRDGWGEHSAPESIHYSVNAGALDAASWYAQTDVHGSLFVGEGGHFIDTVSWWLGSDPVEVSSISANADHTVGSLRYPDGSVAQIAYSSGGHPRSPKEALAIHGGGRSARFDRFVTARLWKGKGRAKTYRSVKGPDKGQRGEMDAFIRAVREGAAMPIPLESLVATTLATLAFLMSAARQLPVWLDHMMETGA